MDVFRADEGIIPASTGWRSRQRIERVEALEAVANAAQTFLALSTLRDEFSTIDAGATDVHEEYREARDNLTAAIANL